MAGINAQKNIYRHLVEVMERLDKVEAELAQEKEQHHLDIQNLKAQHKKEIQKLHDDYRQKIALLENRIAHLEHENALLKEYKAKHESIDRNNSNNTSLPPSTDQRPSKVKVKKANEYNGRKKNGKKSGGQIGHPGHSLLLKDMKERLASNKVDVKIQEIGLPSSKYKERLVIDIPIGVHAKLVRFYADESGRVNLPCGYENEVIYSENVKSFAVYLYGQGVQSLERICHTLSALSGGIIKISEGTVSNWLQFFHDKADPIKRIIENHLLNCHQVCTDGTVVTLNEARSYIRNFSVRDWVMYESMKSKSRKSLSSIYFLRHFCGILSHDHETVMYNYGTGHAECNAHLLRYLRKNSEDTGHKWSDKLISLLCEMNRYVKRLRSQKIESIPEISLKRLESRYDEILSYADKERKKFLCRFEWSDKEERALLKRLTTYKKPHLLFLHDFCVPFDNNMSERDLRKCKNRQKMSGGFRTNHGKEIFCSVLTIIETCKRQSMNIFASLCKVFCGQPLFA